MIASWFLNGLLILAEHCGGPNPCGCGRVFKKSLATERIITLNRLIGMPNEVLEIIDGDIYTCPASVLGDKTIEMLDEVISP